MCEFSKKNHRLLVHKASQYVEKRYKDSVQIVQLLRICRAELICGWLPVTAAVP